MLAINDEIRSTIGLARRKIITNAWSLLQTALTLYNDRRYPAACLNAMTCIEEAGKLQILRMVQGDATKVLVARDTELGPPPTTTTVDVAALDDFLRDHSQKALQGAVSSLFVNAGADRRHGKDDVSGMHRTSGIALLARSGHWMSIRNACQYTDISLQRRSATSPGEAISPSYAYYFICMGFEILAEQAEAGIESGFGSDEAIDFWNERLRDLRAFMDSDHPQVDLSTLDFLRNPAPLEKKAAERRETKSKRKA